MTHRVLPIPNSYMDTRPFWDAANNHVLMLQRCDDTGRYQHPPRPASLYTGSRNVSWIASAGKGTLYSWTVTYSAWPGHEHRVPYICAYVQLEEGARILCNLVNCEAEALTMGMPMKVSWETLAPDVCYPAFEPA